MRRRMVVLALMTGMTLAFFNLYERYESVGPELLANPAFSDGFRHWEISGRGTAEVVDGVAVLQVHEPGAGVAVRQYLPDPRRYRLLSLSGELEARGIRAGKRSWHRGRLALVSFDADQRMMPVPHLVADLEGIRGWQVYRQTLRVPQAVEAVRVSAQLIGAVGSLAVKNLSLREARERQFFGVFRWAGIILWVAVLFWVGLPYLSRIRFETPYLFVFVTALVVFAGTLVPVRAQVAMETCVVEAMLGFAALFGWHDPAMQATIVGSAVVSKLGHLMGFALLGFGLSWAHPRESRWLLIGSLLVVAAVSEVLQFFVDGRLPQLIDFYVDAAGLVLGVAVFSGLRRGIPADVRVR